VIRKLSKQSYADSQLCTMEIDLFGPIVGLCDLTATVSGCGLSY